jgi:hypothetical protein
VNDKTDEKPINRQPVKSSKLKSAGFCADRKCIAVEFASGAVYQYQDCDQDLFDSLLKAESVGKFFNANLRSKPFTKQS